MITSSEMGCHLECPRKRKLKYIEKRIPIKTSPAQAWGIGLHRGLEQWLRLEQMDDQDLREAEMVQAATAEVARLDSLNPFEEASLEVMLRGYHYRWQAAPMRTILVEHHFKLDFCEGTMDALVEIPGDGIYVMEHKSTSTDISPGGNYFQRLSIDHQISIYFQAAKEMKYPIKGIIYDVVAKPRLRPSSKSNEQPLNFMKRCAAAVGEKPEEYYVRQKIYRTQQQLDEAMEDVRDVIALMETGLSPRNTRSCFNWNRPCEYFDVCSGTASLSDNTRFKDEDRYRP